MSEKKFVPKTKEDYTVEEKCETFDKLLKQATVHYNKIMKKGYTDGDDEHFMYESVVSLLGKGVWDAINSKL